MSWRFDPGSSVSGQIAYSLRIKILTGEYPSGSQFPTVRSLALELGVNPNTVQKALSVLEGEGLLESRTTVGRFVTEDSDVLSSALTAFKKSFLESVFSKADEIGITKNDFESFLSNKEG
ncbi:MAG: GntR family transcriptional regulator [Clostridia bacterium]|nr:GntR family transcriptional regulator [Clostridia bacterium]